MPSTFGSRETLAGAAAVAAIVALFAITSDRTGSETPSHETSCTDKVDNDADSLIDCDDTEDCSEDPACITTEIDCSDDIDNDADSLIDCDDTEDCSKDPACMGYNYGADAWWTAWYRR